MAETNCEYLARVYRACDGGTDDYARFLSGYAPSFDLAAQIDRERAEEEN